MRFALAAPSRLARTAAVALAVALAVAACGVPRPRVITGPPPDAVARRVQAAVDTAAWERTGAVRWTFFGGHRHLWDRARDFVRVRWDHDEVLLDLGTLRGVASRDGQPLAADAAAALLDRAHGYWINDAFWLNPVAKMFDPGTRRAIARTRDGSVGVLVTYASGGRTPGDAYLWLLGPDMRPRAWSMWVSVLPIGGVEVSWEDWTRLATGAWIALRHRTLVLDLRLTDVAGAATLAALEPGPDPFAPLVAALAEHSAVRAQPAR